MYSRVFTTVLVLSVLLALQPVSAAHYPIVVYPTIGVEYQTNIEIVIDPTLPLTPLLSEIDALQGHQSRSYGPGGIYSGNILDINYKVLSQEDRDGFTSYLNSIEDVSSPNGHDFNSTAYDQGQSEVFMNITGRSYDAELSLNWLADNLWSGSNNTFTLFLFNLTDLDQGMNHWFTINPEDQDSNTTQVSFFSGTNGLYHGKSVSGWGGHQGVPVHFIDFSSDIWFGDFINTVWGSFNFRDTLLSVKIQDFAPNQSDAMHTWLQDYLYAFMVTTYDFFVFTGAPIGKTVRVPNLILYDWYEYNTTINENRWLVSPDYIDDTFTSTFNWMDFNVTENWVNLNDYTLLLAEMDQYKTPKQDGSGYYVEIGDGFLDYIRYTFIPNNFDLDGADIVLPSVVFFFNQTTFTWGGLPIAGIGGEGYQLQGLTPERYYDNGLPNRGFSDVIIHEVGHSLGLQHPFGTTNLWPGDMTASVMGYYTSAPNFSQYDKNTLGNYHSSYYLAQAKYIQSIDNQTHGYESVFDKLIQDSQEAMIQWEFADSIELSQLALCGYAEFYNVADNRCEGIDFQKMFNPEGPTSPDSEPGLTPDQGEGDGSFLSQSFSQFILSLLIVPVLIKYRSRKISS